MRLETPDPRQSETREKVSAQNLTESDFVELAMSMPVNYQVAFMKKWHEASARGEFLPVVLGRKASER